MFIDKTLLIVGGTGRNVGKTEFVCRLIKKISAAHDVYALKVSAIFPDEEIFHGNHQPDETENHLFEETRMDTNKDTSRMLQSGAKQVFYLRGEDSRIAPAYTSFRTNLPNNAVIICESNSLGKFIRPGLQIMVRQKSGPVKPRAVKSLQQADMIICSDGKSGFPELDQIDFNSYKLWHLNK